MTTSPIDPPPPTTRMREHPGRGRRPLVEPVSAELSRADTDALLVAAGHGDLAAFATFYDRTAPVVFGMLHRVLGPRAEHTTEQVYLQLWRTAPSFDPHARSAYATLLFTARRALTASALGLLTGNAASADAAPRGTADTAADGIAEHTAGGIASRAGMTSPVGGRR